ncbi:hypothetical protein [Arhodomonas aquaeolei]|uniref:hypothetical protein n=1 Tax=Arhodomonas aquaeolei TaxID=2369 RepID=UPI0003718AD1|nr:hypothetical protein [Arhodomonas aquaeolei]
MTVLLRSLLVMLVLALASGGVGVASVRVPANEAPCARSVADADTGGCMTVAPEQCPTCPQAAVISRSPVSALTAFARAVAPVRAPVPALRAAWTDPHYRPPALRG